MRRMGVHLFWALCCWMLLMTSGAQPAQAAGDVRPASQGKAAVGPSVELVRSKSKASESRASRDEDEDDEDEDDTPRKSRKAKQRKAADDDEDEDIEEVPMSEKLVILPFMMVVGLLPCFFPLAGLLTPFFQFRYVVGRPGFKNPVRGLAAGYLGVLGMFLGGAAYFCVCGGLSIVPGLALALAADSTLGSSCMGLGFGAVWLVGVLGMATFWLAGEPLLLWYFAQ